MPATSASASSASNRSMRDRRIPVHHRLVSMPARWTVSRLSQFDPHLQADWASSNDCESAAALLVSSHDARDSSSARALVVDLDVVEVEQHPRLTRWRPRDRSIVLPLGHAHRRHRQQRRRRESLMLCSMRLVQNRVERHRMRCRFRTRAASLVPAKHIEHIAISTPDNATRCRVCVASVEAFESRCQMLRTICRDRRHERANSAILCRS
jgi:hypothetical protein